MLDKDRELIEQLRAGEQAYLSAGDLDRASVLGSAADRLTTLTQAPQIDRTAYTDERAEHEQPQRISINTKVPSKWRFVDLETGDVWKWAERPGYGQQDFRRAEAADLHRVIAPPELGGPSL